MVNRNRDKPIVLFKFPIISFYQFISNTPIMLKIIPDTYCKHSHIVRFLIQEASVIVLCN